MSVELIKMWHERARPDPLNGHMNIQTGCHFEEIQEMLEAVHGADDYSELMLERLTTALSTVALGLKHGHIRMVVKDRKEFLDSLADQIVTAVGVGHCANMNIVEACRRVNSSNWSKYDHDGKPIFNEHGKIIKGPDYKAPDLEGLY